MDKVFGRFVVSVDETHAIMPRVIIAPSAAVAACEYHVTTSVPGASIYVSEIAPSTRWRVDETVHEKGITLVAGAETSG